MFSVPVFWNTTRNLLPTSCALFLQSEKGALHCCQHITLTQTETQTEAETEAETQTHTHKHARNRTQTLNDHNNPLGLEGSRHQQASSRELDDSVGGIGGVAAAVSASVSAS